MIDIEKIGYAPFTGDGRIKSTAPHQCVLAGTVPMRVTNSQAHVTINQFCRAGRTVHSGAGGTLWVILTWLHHHKLPYRLSAAPGVGYMVEQFDPDFAREKVQPRGPADGC